MNTEDSLKLRAQEHILSARKKLNEKQRAAFDEQLSAVDWDMLSLRERVRPSGEIAPIKGLSLGELQKNAQEYAAIGKAAIKEGKLAAVLLAGGQGTRLGSDAPKGVFNMGLKKDLPIFGLLMERLKAVCASCGVYLPLAVMTSEKNDFQTRAFFEERNYFGYPEEYVGFFVQDMAPSVDFNGKLLMENESELVRSPNGNGGWYSSLSRSRLLERKAFRAVEWFNVFAVDNVLQHIADPVFLGATIRSGCQTGAKVVAKACPEERVGVLLLENNRPRVVEYYELPPEMANERDESGALVYRYGVILNYLFERAALQKIAGAGIPVHVVAKKIPYWSEEEGFVEPAEPNGYKFETLILDLIEQIGSCLPCEVEREKEFAPVKNKTGVDSVDTARALLQKNGVEL